MPVGPKKAARPLAPIAGIRVKPWSAIKRVAVSGDQQCVAGTVNLECGPWDGHEGRRDAIIVRERVRWQLQEDVLDSPVRKVNDRRLGTARGETNEQYCRQKTDNGALHF
jgi:hypothetical protein